MRYMKGEGGIKLEIAYVGEGGVFKLLMVADVGIKIWQKSADVIYG